METPINEKLAKEVQSYEFNIVPEHVENMSREELMAWCMVETTVHVRQTRRYVMFFFWVALITLIIACFLGIYSCAQ